MRVVSVHCMACSLTIQAKKVRSSILSSILNVVCHFILFESQNKPQPDLKSDFNLISVSIRPRFYVMHSTVTVLVTNDVIEP